LLSQLRRYEKQQERREAERNATSRYPTGHEARRKEVVVEALRRLTKARDLTTKHKINEIVNRIIDHATRLCCGNIEVYDIPKKFMEFDSFQKSHFENTLKYKCEEFGFKLTFHETAQVKQVLSAALSGV